MEVIAPFFPRYTDTHECWRSPPEVKKLTRVVVVSLHVHTQCDICILRLHLEPSRCPGIFERVPRLSISLRLTSVAVRSSVQMPVILLA